jgi:hypothetical protein
MRFKSQRANSTRTPAATTANPDTVTTAQGLAAHQCQHAVWLFEPTDSGERHIAPNDRAASPRAACAQELIAILAAGSSLKRVFALVQVTLHEDPVR